MAPPSTWRLVLAVGDGPWSIERGADRVEVREVPDVERALEVLEDATVDCVVASLDLPDDDGIGLCEAVREREPELPVLLFVDDRRDLGERAVDALDAGVTRVVDAGDDLDAAVATEVDRYREYRERTRQSEMFESVLRQIPLSIYVKDERGVIDAASENMVPDGSTDFIQNVEGKIHQHTDDIIGKTDYDLFDYAPQAVADDRTVLETEEPIVDKIEEVRDPHGEPLYYSTSKAPRYDADGNVAGVVGASLDVTERVENRREVERRNEQLDEFASVLSHDLRNPLSVAMGYLEGLGECYDDDAIGECMTSLERIETLIEELLTFAREGRTVVEPDDVDLEVVSREAWANVETGDATLEVDTHRPVEADRDRLQRLLENLFRNSVEHGSSGAESSGPDEEVSTADSESDVEDDVLTVRVADDGPDFYVEDDGAGFGGVDPADAFERGVTTAADGTGIGLAIVQNIANAHGWTVDASEPDDGGARFEFARVVRSDSASTAVA